METDHRPHPARTNSKDPAGQLSGLFEKTNDAMVAFELARYFETSRQNGEAAKWYMIAADRFRRADWKSKAQEAAVRLGAELAQDAASGSPMDAPSATPPDSGPELAPAPETSSATPEAEPEQTSEGEEVFAVLPESSNPPAAAQKRRRRGRRGGRNRRGSAPSRVSGTAPTGSPRSDLPASTPTGVAEIQAPRTAHSRSIPAIPVEPPGEMGSPGVRGRSGDPGLSSRLSALEMQLRRLLTCPPATLNDADRAPAGPGVFVLTDSDLTSYYYVEACQTLRIAIGNLMRGGASRRGADSLKPRLAEHLGIPESRVTKYLADHCVVRWLQLDEGASHFAHFVTAVIRPILNE